MRFHFLTILLAAVVISACSLPATTSTPESNVQLVSPIPEMSQTITAPVAPTKTIGTPIPGWENIPIMPGAYNGELDDITYLYSVQETVESVEEYYQAKMKVNGWTLTSRRPMETATSGPATVLDFQKENQVLNIMLVQVPEDDATAVLLMRLGP